MRQLLGIWGYVIVIGYLLKILFQMYWKYKSNEDLNIGAGNTFGWEYWRPIRMQDGSRLNWLRKIFNFIHIFGILYLFTLLMKAIFAIGK